MRVLFPFLLSLLLSLAFLPDTALADTATGYDRQIQMIGRQSSLGHRLVRSLCFAQAGIDTARNLRVIEDSRTEVRNTLHTLLEGDPTRGIAAIDNSNIRTQIGSLEKVWNALDKKTTAFLDGTAMSDEEVIKMTFKAESLEKLWRNVSQSLETMTSIDSTPENLARARIIVTATDQNRLLQQAGKDACLIHLAGGAAEAGHQVEELNAALATFDRNIFDLTFVRPAAINASPQPEAMEQAAFDTWQTWVGLESLFQGVSHPGKDERLDMLLPEISFTVEYLDQALQDTLEVFLSL
ncbi:type IV pili methyl-accepting chemotaxis transducer N-terminal domain-containing protein [Celeribacter ethanolicus]|uniref:type IV pili methyl-accepting chemotaxis transducer N-terminal domain-containing protein n=1 Tax=Celeribacter ethanolicus TaxID=1758178 RepID=UPI000831081D|nr:type IV pili methyl-accepting chemotaxis transducer N-terminal domain-containing protein [Celeribacter ethanolicus]